MNLPQTEDKKRWLVAYVKMHHEKKVHDKLLQMGFEVFLPLQEELRKWSDRMKKVERVVIPMMIFVRVSVYEQLEVLKLPSVIRYMVLRNENKPAVIPDRQMEQFRFMLDVSDQRVEMMEEMPVPGEKVRVVKGSLKGLEGELTLQDGKHRIAVRISQLGFATVELGASFVEKIENFQIST